MASGGGREEQRENPGVGEGKNRKEREKDTVTEGKQRAEVKAESFLTGELMAAYSDDSKQARHSMLNHNQHHAT